MKPLNLLFFCIILLIGCNLDKPIESETPNKPIKTSSDGPFIGPDENGFSKPNPNFPAMKRKHAENMDSIGVKPKIIMPTAKNRGLAKIATNYEEQGNEFAASCGGEMYRGDFDGDGLQDALCHHSSGWWPMRVSLTSNGSEWVGRTGWCSHSGAGIFVEKLNTDSRTDLMCNDDQGNYWVIFTQSGGSLQNYEGLPGFYGWCSHSTAKISQGDVNGDGRHDLLCHDDSGNNWVVYTKSDGRYPGSPAYYQYSSQCAESNSMFRLERLNSDSRDDAVCVTSSEPPSWNYFSAVSGEEGFNFGTSSWRQGLPDYLSVGISNPLVERPQCCEPMGWCPYGWICQGCQCALVTQRPILADPLEDWCNIRR